MPRVIRRVLVLMVLVSSSPTVEAQSSSPVQDMLALARSALNDLRYAEADSIARAVLELPTTRRADRILALQLLAGARYPEQAGVRSTEGALEALRQLVRLAPNTGLPREVSWPGLDSLYRDVRSGTFGASAAPAPSNVMVGPEGVLVIPVVASRPARFVLSARQLDSGHEELLDSIPLTDRGSLRVRALEDQRARFKSGPTEFRIEASDPATGETILLRFDGMVEAPALVLLSPPPPLDPATFLPELSRPNRAGGIAAGLAAAGATLAVAALARDQHLKDLVARDGRAVTAGLFMGVALGAGVWLLDQGAPLRENIAANAARRAEHAAAVAQVDTENRARVAGYRAVITFTTEPR